MTGQLTGQVAGQVAGQVENCWRTKMNPLIKSLHLKNVLSYGPDGVEIELKSLNVMIGPNGSGKSNLIECLALLRETPHKLELPIREGGGMSEWIFKGANSLKFAHLEAVIDNPKGKQALRHTLKLVYRDPRFEVMHEIIENERAYPNNLNPYFYYSYINGVATINERISEDNTQKRTLNRELLGPEQSVLNVLKEPDRYPEVTHLGKVYSEEIKIYREWSMGRYGAPRLSQPADLSVKFMDEDFRNLGMVLNDLDNRHPKVKDRIVKLLQTLYPSVQDIKVYVQSNQVQVFLREGDVNIPATRLSDGTLRFLCLLTLLLHPEPPRLICIEEPEIGLHPDVIGTLAEVLLEASERTQLIITTHSVRLIDGLSEHPESVIVCEKCADGSSLKRLDSSELEPWLKDYSLGNLWVKGELGGNRW